MTIEEKNLIANAEFGVPYNQLSEKDKRFVTEECCWDDTPDPEEKYWKAQTTWNERNSY